MKNLKKIVICFLLLVACHSLLVTVHAQTPLSDRLDDLSDESMFGYNESIKISISEITPQKVVISSPVIVDELGGKIRTYTIMYSPYTVEEMTTSPALLNQAKEKTFNFTGTETVLKMELNLYDGLDPTKVYYVNVIPKDANGIPGQISTQDLRFKLATLESGEGTYTGSPLLAHAAGANMALANISHSCNPDCLATTTQASKKITLTWIAVAGSDDVEISAQLPGSNSFTTLATVNMTDEKYELQTNKNGEHIFKFTPDNGGTETHYTVNINGIGTTGTPATGTGITKVPKT